MSIVYVIPSYKRVDILKEKTLSLLNSYKILEKDIYIFLANKEEYELYKSSIGGKYNYIKGIKLLYKQRNYISHYFKEGQKLVWLDDDIDKITILGNGKLNSLSSLKLFIDKAFKTCIDNNAFIWGIYPVDNHYFMRNKITTDLRYIIGAFYGTINRHSKDLVLNIEEKEDVLRTLQYYTKDKKLIRFWNVGIKTKYFGTGGMSVGRDRIKEGKIAVEVLHKKYPNLTKIKNPTNSHPYYELLLNDKIKI